MIFSAPPFLPRTIAIAIFVYVLIVLVMVTFQRILVFPAGRRRPDLASAGLPERAREVQIRTADGLMLLAWYIPPEKTPDGTDDMPVLLCLHGNAGTIQERAYKVAPIVAKGYGALMLEYRGYGANPGKPDETGLYTDAAAALAFLIRHKIPPERVILWGESLGTGVAVQAAVTCAALEVPVRAVILEAPYTSLPDVAARHYPWLPVRLMLQDRFDTASRISFLGVPLFIMHGERDRTIPASHSRRLFDLAKPPRQSWFAPQGGHMDLFDHGGGAMILEFLSSI